MFIGEINTKIDEKGRAPFPAIFRRLLKDGARLVASKDLFEQCIKIQTFESWIEEKERLSKRLNEYNRTHKAIFRQFNLNRHEITLDAFGRISLPKTLLEYCNIIKEVAFIGQDEYIEIWSKENREQLEIDPTEFGTLLETTLG